MILNGQGILYYLSIAKSKLHEYVQHFNTLFSQCYGLRSKPWHLTVHYPQLIIYFLEEARIHHFNLYPSYIKIFKKRIDFVVRRLYIEKPLCPTM